MRRGKAGAADAKMRFAASIVKAAIAQKMPIAVCLRRPKEEFISDLIATMSGVDAELTRKGFFTKDKWTAMTRAAEILSGAPIYIDDSPGPELHEMGRRLSALDRELRRKKQRLGAVIFA